MECWNATCAITRLPILEGEAFYAMLVAPRGARYQEARHAWGVYAPVTPLMRGRCNRCGVLDEVEYDPALCQVLNRMGLCFKKKDGSTGPMSKVTEQNFQDRLAGILEAAAQCRLTAALSDDSEAPEQRHVYLLSFKKRFADALMRENEDSRDIRSVTCRLYTIGPLQEQLRRFDPAFGAGLPDDPHGITEGSAKDLLSFLAGMDRMRIALAPTCDSSSRETMARPWMQRLYLSMWVEAERTAWHGTETRPGPFSFSASWDGSSLSTATGAGNRPRSDAMPVQADPESMYGLLLENAAAKLVTAIDGTPEGEDGPAG